MGEFLGSAFEFMNWLFGSVHFKNPFPLQVAHSWHVSSRHCPGPPAGEARSTQAGRGPTVAAARARLHSHGGFPAAPTRSDPGLSRLGQAHPVIVHHQTLPVKEALQRGPAPRQRAEGHRNWCAGQGVHGPGEAHAGRPHDSSDTSGAEKSHSA